MSAAGTRYLSIRLLGAVVVAAVIVNHHVSVLVVEAGGRDQLPAAAVVREVVPGGTHNRTKGHRKWSERGSGAGSTGFCFDCSPFQRQKTEVCWGILANADPRCGGVAPSVSVG